MTRAHEKRESHHPDQSSVPTLVPLQLAGTPEEEACGAQPASGFTLSSSQLQERHTTPNPRKGSDKPRKQVRATQSRRLRLEGYREDHGV